MNEFLNEELERATEEKAGWTSRNDLKTNNKQNPKKLQTANPPPPLQKNPNKKSPKQNRRGKGGECHLFITTELETNFKCLFSESKEIPLASSSK